LEDLSRVVRVAAQMFVNVLDRVRVENELRKRLDLERLLTTFASDFINLPVGEIDAGIDGAIAQLGRYAGVDRVGIFQLSTDGTEVRTTHEWHSDAADDRPRAVRVRPRAGLGPLFDRLFAGETIQVSNTAELPPESSAIRDTSDSYGIRSFINVPLVVGGTVVGWLGLGTEHQAMHWPEDAVALLKLAAEMFANALARIEAERAMRRHQAELAHVLRVGTMGQLAAGLAHELNQPLSAILSYASGCTRRLEAGGAAPGELVGAMQRISEQALRAADFIKALRELVRKGEPHREWHDLNALVRGAIRMIDAELALADVALQFDPATGLKEVQVNASQMQQVVLNLLQNALDALRDLPVDRTRTLRVSTAMVRPGLVSIRVEDDGPGVEEHLRQTIFDDFHTSKPGGLGLGLSISRTLVEAHGGTLSVDSIQEKTGAAFIVTLPSAA
jgi:signal transduction histidine kinase